MAMTAAEKMRRYREKKKAQGLKQVNTWIMAGETGKEQAAPDSRREQWEKELKAEQLAAARKEGRRLARAQDKSTENGRINGLCTAAAYFIGHDRADITRALLSHFMIDRETAAAALEADKRTKSITLESLDKAAAWNEPPKVIK